QFHGCSSSEIQHSTTGTLEAVELRCPNTGDHSLDIHFFVGSVLDWIIFTRKHSHSNRPHIAFEPRAKYSQALTNTEKEELPILQYLLEQSVKKRELVQYTFVVYHINKWEPTVRGHMCLGRLEPSLDQLLREASFPRQYPATYSRIDVMILPLLAHCAADQYINGLGYDRVEDEMCSHTKDREGGISALFGDLSSLNNPSRIELHVIVQLVLWRNRPFDEECQSIWKDLQLGHCSISGTPYSQRLLAYALQRLRMFIITTWPSVDSPFLQAITSQASFQYPFHHYAQNIIKYLGTIYRPLGG
ncbi:hypothetical protein FRC19_005974, partial [Serendipita sp. 401]